MIFMLDNYDSFTYNLVHLLYSLEARVEVRRNREVTVDEVLRLRPDALVLSPGPGRPDRAGILLELIKAAAAEQIPMLGVCLGHQAIGQAFGGKIVNARAIVHGKTSKVAHDSQGLFTGLVGPFQAVRYHSLALDRDSLPAELEITATTADGEIMGVRHRTLPIEGIQYHPESIMTSVGKTQLGNFLKQAGEFRRNGRAR